MPVGNRGRILCDVYAALGKLHQRGPVVTTNADIDGTKRSCCVGIDSFEDSDITYEKTVALLKAHKDLQGIYITCGGVSQVGRALEESGRAKDIRVISYEDYPEVVELIRKDVVDCTIAGEIQKQGEIPVQIIMDHIVFGKSPESDQVFTETKILVKESL